jgi:osmotically-inducible protein OsmY
MKPDAQLQHDVLQELAWDPSIDASQIGVTARDGVVSLTGAVPVYAQKFQAEKAAKRVHGVKAIANDIEVTLDHSGQPTDADIAAAVLHTLKWNGSVPADRIGVTVRDGWITLDGTVDWQFQKDAVNRAVRHLMGARGVTNSILVKPRKKTEDVKAGIEAALRRSATVDSKKIGVETDDGTVILTGDVHSYAERDQAERTAWAAPGVSRVENCITVTPWGSGCSEEWGY